MDDGMARLKHTVSLCDESNQLKYQLWITLWVMQMSEGVIFICSLIRKSNNPTRISCHDTPQEGEGFCVVVLTQKPKPKILWSSCCSWFFTEKQVWDRPELKNTEQKRRHCFGILKKATGT